MAEPVKPVGGWSGHGQPVDQLHAQYRQKIRLLGLKKIKMGENLFERPAYEDLPLRPSGLVCFAIVLRSSVKRSFTQL
jgi:hypothetical protein